MSIPVFRPLSNVDRGPEIVVNVVRSSRKIKLLGMVLGWVSEGGSERCEQFNSGKISSLFLFFAKSVWFFLSPIPGGVSGWDSLFRRAVLFSKAGCVGRE
jgi:hypothetical protein